jgi:pimeloyl-ACP methyl ester carboxylesterase
VQAHWSQPKSFLGMANYLESLPASASEASACGDLPAHIPITILSASNSTVAQLAERDAIARYSLHGKHIIAAKSGHWIHFDEPELVIRSIREIAAPQ